jgi:hypothetical protein
VPFTSAGQVRVALAAAGVAPTVTTMRYDVGHADRAVVEGFLQRCVFDDSVPLDRMEDEGSVGAYLAGCVDGEGYRFTQVVDVITWEAAA